ncbi:MAG: transcription antitermination factor NusB [Fibrobacter sp.]|nr:transcription antitermination factor NusB [Fibrobacter sp.]
MAQVSFRPARVFAMQLLYAMEISGGTVADALPGVLEAQPLKDDMKKYGMKLVDLVLAHKAELDAEIEACSAHWGIERMATLDRIIIRIAMVELLYVTDVPFKVVVSEAIQIAAKFSTDSSNSFVNGLLAGFMQKRGMVVNTTKKDA